MPTCPSFHTPPPRFRVWFTKPVEEFPPKRSEKEKQWSMMGMLAVVKVRALLELP
jgi:hypothetical protein